MRLLRDARVESGEGPISIPHAVYDQQKRGSLNRIFEAMGSRIPSCPSRRRPSSTSSNTTRAPAPSTESMPRVACEPPAPAPAADRRPGSDLHRRRDRMRDVDAVRASTRCVEQRQFHRHIRLV
jgi:hypothetical protein